MMICRRFQWQLLERQVRNRGCYGDTAKDYVTCLRVCHHAQDTCNNRKAISWICFRSSHGDQKAFKISIWWRRPQRWLTCYEKNLHQKGKARATARLTVRELRCSAQVKSSIYSTNRKKNAYFLICMVLTERVLSNSVPVCGPRH